MQDAPCVPTKKNRAQQEPISNTKYRHTESLKSWEAKNINGSASLRDRLNYKPDALQHSLTYEHAELQIRITKKSRHLHKNSWERTFYRTETLRAPDCSSATNDKD